MEPNNKSPPATSTGAVARNATVSASSNNANNNNNNPNQLSVDQVHEVSRHFLHNHVNPLIAVEAAALYDPTFQSYFGPFSRNIEAYCTVRKPKRFSVPQIVVSDGNKAYLLNMGNNHGPIQTTDLDDSDDGSLRSSYDSTTRSLLNQFEENESCFDIDLSTTKDELTLTNSSGDDPLSFEDDFNPTVIEKDPPVQVVHYCTLRHKPKEVNPQEKFASTYATLRKKFTRHARVAPLERVDTITSLDCVERVNDYLFELDTYLEEMDQSPPTTTPRHSSQRQRSYEPDTCPPLPPPPPSQSQIPTGDHYTTHTTTINSNTNDTELSKNPTTMIQIEENQTQVAAIESDCGNVIVPGPTTTIANRQQMPLPSTMEPETEITIDTAMAGPVTTTTKNKTDNRQWPSGEMEAMMMAKYANGSAIESTSHINNHNHLFYTLPKRQSSAEQQQQPPTKKVNGNDGGSRHGDANGGGDLVHGINNGNATGSQVNRSQSVVLRRGQSLRQPSRATWAPTNESARSNAVEGNASLDVDHQRPKRHLSWLRKSMRKTKPINIPDRDPSPDAPIYENTSFAAAGELSTIGSVDSGPQTTMTSDSTFESFNTVYYDCLPPQHDTDTVIHSIQSHATPSSSFNQVPRIELQHDDILNVILNSSTESGSSDDVRPRQMGRRSDPRPRVVSIDATTPQRQTISMQGAVPFTPTVHGANGVNGTGNATGGGTSAGSRQYLAPPVTQNQTPPPFQSENSSIQSSRNPSPVSLVSSTGSSSVASAVGNNQQNRPRRNTNQRQRHQNVPQVSVTSHDRVRRDDSQDDDTEPCNKHKWPHLFSRTLATTCCTVGLFNISRFSIFSIHFGANFIVQFLILSFLVGVPMLWLQMTLGATIRVSPIGLWHISPICKGIGIALLMAHGITTLYSAISLGWVLIYLRDTFISWNDQYQWQQYFELYRGPSNSNQSMKIAETVADYFNGVVLQRFHLGNGRTAPVVGMGGVRFHLALNLAIVWMFIFFILCRGIRSYGRFIIFLSIAPIIGLIAVSSKFLSIISIDSIQNIFPATDWQEFFLNSHSWVSAAQETFLTWGLLGVSVYSIYCNSSRSSNNKTELGRDAIIVVILTCVILILAAMFASSCVQILLSHGYYYFPGSFENMGSYVFLLPTDRPLPSQLASTPSKWLSRYSTVLGESFRKFNVAYPKESGYQVLRLVTELLPSTLAATSHELIPPIVAMIAYLTLFLFGLAQLATMWKPLASLLGDSPSGVLLSCVTALFLGIPLATESGISIIHFLDTVIGGAWWLLLLWFAHIIGIFLVRGRPYTSDILVQELHFFDGYAAFIAFSWNVLLPVALMILCIIEYRLSNVYDFFHWRGNSYWPLWSRQVAGIIQTLFLLIVPITCIIQIYRYLSKGPPDILERIEALYRPILRNDREHRHPPLHRTRQPNVQNHTVISLTEGQSNNPIVQVDEPPKYTPPPSYTTATGARIAKMLRQSIRRSVRRILGEPSRRQQSMPPPVNGPPPDYHENIVETRNETVSCIEMGPRPMYNSATMERRRIPNPDQVNSQPLQPQDVALLLRPSRLMTFSRTMSLGDAVITDNVLRNSTRRHSRSVENLVLNAEGIGRSSIINLTDSTTKDDINVGSQSVI